MHYSTRPKSGKSPYQAVRFPDVGVTGHGILDAEIRDYEGAAVVFKDGDNILLRNCLTKLSSSNNIEPIPDDEMIFFIHNILRRYCVEDRALRSITPGKHYHPVIAKCDEPRFADQVKKHMNLALRLLIALDVQNLSRDQDFKCTIDLTNKLSNAFKSHHQACGSCRINTSDNDFIEDHCTNFAQNIALRWDILHNKPFLIYMLWASKSQNKVANSDLKITPQRLRKLILDSFNDKTKVKAKENKSSENASLFNKLLEICFSGAIDSWTKQHIMLLFEELDHQETRNNFFKQLSTQINENLSECLSFSPVCLTECDVSLIMPPKELPTQPNGGDRVAVWNKWEQWLKDSPRIIQKLEYMQPELSAGLAGQIVLERWLESKPEIINELCSELSKRKGHKRLL